MQVTAVDSAIHSNVPASILQALSQLRLEDSTAILNLPSDSPDDRSARHVDSATAESIQGMSEIRNAFLAAMKVGELVQNQSLFDSIQ